DARQGERYDDQQRRRAEEPAPRRALALFTGLAPGRPPPVVVAQVGARFQIGLVCRVQRRRLLGAADGDPVGLVAGVVVCGLDLGHGHLRIRVRFRYGGSSSTSTALNDPQTSTPERSRSRSTEPRVTSATSGGAVASRTPARSPSIATEVTRPDSTLRR